MNEQDLINDIERNERLRDAAPDLLAALKIVEDASASWLTLGERAQIRAAIAKAEGRS